MRPPIPLWILVIFSIGMGLVIEALFFEDADWGSLTAALCIGGVALVSFATGFLEGQREEVGRVWINADEVYTPLDEEGLEQLHQALIEAKKDRD